MGKEYNTLTLAPSCTPGVILGRALSTRLASSTSAGCGALT